MAKYECELYGDFARIYRDIDDAVVNGSMSATREDYSDLSIGDCKCVVTVYERYSWMGGNRVSMNVTLMEANGHIKLSAITSGGSQAMFFKVNTWGEESFLETISEVVEQYRRNY
ncbi:MAG: hypothetical protein IJY09_10205 [Lachnospiraceae bacterium]|nr:hypothetical protein [Lachnospiraceae bacterium]